MKTVSNQLNKVKRYFENNLTAVQLDHIRRSYIKFLAPIPSRVFSSDLNALSVINFSDKGPAHDYVRHYMKYFHGLRKKKLKILEIGAGGYDNPKAGGNSLRMWKYYFPRSTIYSIDIHEKELPQDERIRIFRGSQADRKFLEYVFSEMGSVDIVIDDGSHKGADVITAFTTLFPLLKGGGIYSVEDTNTSYFPEWGGSDKDPDRPETTMGFFKGLTDRMNHTGAARPDDPYAYFVKNIAGIHFYRDLVVILKEKLSGSTDD
ncbi:MAG: class I SAM-dependent methyltransferase [Candidatus Omnitrophota bacterium]